MPNALSISFVSLIIVRSRPNAPTMPTFAPAKVSSILEASASLKSLTKLARAIFNLFSSQSPIAVSIAFARVFAARETSVELFTISSKASISVSIFVLSKLFKLIFGFVTSVAARAFKESSFFSSSHISL